MTVFLGYVFGVLFAVLCLLASFLLYKMGVEKRYTRKVVHILIGFEWILLNHFFGSTYHLLVVCLVFLALLVIVHKKRLMPMISSDGENAPGTVYYCVSMSVMSLVTLIEPRFMLPFGIAVFCTSLGDGFAGVVGYAVKKYNPRIWKNKTVVGTLTGFTLSFLTSAVFIIVFNLDRPFMSGVTVPVFSAVFIALLAAELELFTGRGLDNITLPLGVSALSYFLLYYNKEALGYILPVLLTPLMLAVVLEKKVLTASGTVAAVLLDVAVSVAFGNMGFLMMAVFLVGGVAIDKVKARVKHGHLGEAKNDRSRDVLQVLANGLPAFLLSFAYLFTKETVFLVAFSVVAAEAFADTAGSGFGVFAKRTFDLFRLKPAEQGMSGGVSAVGTLASAVAAASVAFIPLAFGAYGLTSVLFVAAVAFSGSLFDSFLGSVFQVKFRCPRCGKLTERNMHCSTVTVKTLGFLPVDNDFVNFASGCASAIAALVLYFVIF